MDFEDLEELAQGRRIGRVNALLLADGGFAPLNPPEWLGNLAPQMVLLSVAAGNADGLPSAELIAALDDNILLRTDQAGWLRLLTDGEQMWVETER
jgi:beta-lactamase superfamily II metal-dependent hydrolase